MRDWHEAFARHLIEAQANSTGNIRLIVDGTKVGFGHPLLMVATAYRRHSTIGYLPPLTYIERVRSGCTEQALS